MLSRTREPRKQGNGCRKDFQLKKLGFTVRILETSSRVGGRVITLREPLFAPTNHFLLRAYFKNFNIDSYLPFEMKNKFIYLSSYRGGTTMTYDDFDDKLVKKEAELLKLFPGLKDREQGKTCDQLFFEAVDPVVKAFKKAYDAASGDTNIHAGYQAVTDAYDKYTLRSFLEEVACWSFDAIRLFDLGNAHVVFENAFIESWKDAFLSSNSSGEAAGMEQLQGGMDQVPKAFISPDRGANSLAENVTYGARVTHIVDVPATGDQPSQIQVNYETPSGTQQSVSSNYVIFAVPYGAQRAITKSRPFSPTITKILLQYRTRWWEQAAFGAHGQGTDGGLISDLPIRYTMFPTTVNNEQYKNTTRGAVIASYTFQQDATTLGAMSPERCVHVAAENIDHIFPGAGSLQYLKAGASQVFPSDELAGGSAFCYFGPGQKSTYLETMVFFAGEHASYTHGWIHGAMEAGLRCVQQVYAAATAT
ncbi:hypothetical protein B0T26DRAFT_812554 [Lasiosphaeria miniovina]|uniref:Amine oxidase domain-containing protein n=1 Tax=Lasiosphaeria miniovina TaxID=1954250 RepID=A0AA40DVN0_9PEZI|nr:uncharacterized protein B0T26DRAFT_812554 [Lasiosphaeria miniovina]KAK0718039.1 hypothetical protein B0T26DRAFT_812554 [Lasiosphaeria miniovina]